MKRSIAMFAVLAVLGSTASGRIHDDALPYERAVRSVVWVRTLDRDWEESCGTGVVVDAGLILTAYHVVKDAALVWAHAPERDEDGNVVNSPKAYGGIDGETMKCAVLLTDAQADLALLSVRKGEKRGSPMRVAKQGPTPGEPIFTIGNCPDILFRYAGGSVKAVLDDTASFAGQEVKARMIEMTVPINAGDSGGPVVNAKGELVGINSYTDESKNQVHRAIEVSEIRKFMGWKRR